MQDTNSLSDYNLEDGCKVHLILQKDALSNPVHVVPSPSSSSTTSRPMDESLNRIQTNENPFLHRPPAATSSMTTSAATTTTTNYPKQEQNSDSAGNRPLSRFEMILIERLGRHFSPPVIEKIMANLHHDINTDINSSSLDDLERLAKQKLNISNE